MRKRIHRGFHRIGLVFSIGYFLFSSLFMLFFIHRISGDMGVTYSIILYLFIASIIYIFFRVLGWAALGFVKEEDL